MILKKRKLSRPKRRPMSRTARKRAVQKNLPGVLLLITAGIVLGLITLLLYHLIGKPAYHLIADPLIAREWIGQFGLKGYLLFIFIMFLQIVIAVIPGEPLEIAAGLVFGPVVGTILCFIGILLGSIVTFMLTRIFGMKLLRCRNWIFCTKTTTPWSAWYLWPLSCPVRLRTCWPMPSV